MRVQSTTRDTGDHAPYPLPGPGRLDSYRLLARRAARHADSAKRLASDNPARSQLPIPRRAAGGNAATASGRAESASSTVTKPHWAAEVEIRCFGRFQVSHD